MTTRKTNPRRGPGWLTLVIIAVAGALSYRFYEDRQTLLIGLLLLTAFGVLYLLEAPLSARFRRFHWLYFPAQTALLLALSSLEPLTDTGQLLYIPLGLQALRAGPPRLAAGWLALFAVCLITTLVLEYGWVEGLALGLLIMAVAAFLLSYDRLGEQMANDQEEGRRLLAELQQAHQKLKEHAGRAEELAAARERNRLARELHDSVSQSIFAVTLTSRAARLLLERDPAGVPPLLERLQQITAAALSRLRSLIAQLRPPPAA
jgi:signal transduction histidine kinase